MVTSIQYKEYRRCKHTNERGEQDCTTSGIYLLFNEKGKVVGPLVNRRCYAHKLPGQVSQSIACRKAKKQGVWEPRIYVKKIQKAKVPRSKIKSRAKMPRSKIKSRAKVPTPAMAESKRRTTQCTFYNQGVAAFGQQPGSRCPLIGSYYRCNEDGSSWSAYAYACRKCVHHKTVGQVNANSLRIKIKRSKILY